MFINQGLNQVSRYVISSKVIARDIERNRNAKERRFYPGKLTLLVLVNVVLWLLIFSIAAALDLI